MHKSPKTPDVPPKSGTASLSIIMSMALAASAGVIWWSGGGANSFSLTGNGSPSLETRVAALTSELTQLKVETARLRDRQNDASGELIQLRASLTSTETGLATLRSAADETEARRRDTADKIEQDLALLKRQAIRLRSAQEDTSTELSTMRAAAATSDMSIEQLRSTTGELRQQVARIETAREATSSIGRPYKHRVRRVARAAEPQPQLTQPFVMQWPGVVPAGRN
jgi:chromosome segregation ATPase